MITRKALIVGIDYYDAINHLHGCVNDSESVIKVLQRNTDGTINFSIKKFLAKDKNTAIDRKTLKRYVDELFKDPTDVALFYFAGHGYLETTGGFLITSDCNYGDEGFSMNELLTFANRSPSKNKIIVLDCCHSGKMGESSTSSGNSELSEGLTILTASSASQYASEVNGTGVFTNLFVDALNGSAANLLGEITPGSVYAHIDQALGPWEQRPIFKTNVSTFTSLRKVEAPISLDDLKKITQFFSQKDDEFQLDPSFEPESASPKANNTVIFEILQKYNRVNLLVPVGAEHMYFAAMESKSCKLTALGKHYWSLVKNNKI